MSRAPWWLALSLLAACIEVEPPVGQFLCETADQCPDAWVCGPDRRCYAAPLACYPHVQVGCDPGESCYTSTTGVYCTTTGPLPEYANGCDNSVDSLRCGPGMACVSFGEDSLDDNFCLRLCRDSSDCGVGALCDVELVASDEIVATLGKDFRTCSPSGD